MDIKNLAKIDLARIDWNRAGAYLSVHADALLRVLMIVITVWGMLKVMDDYVKQTKVFSVQIAEIEEKMSQVAGYDKSVGMVKAFWEKAPKFLNDDALINFVTDVATKNNIDILSFSPGQRSGDKFAEISKTKFKVKAKDYKDLLLFVRNIESSGYALRIESFNGAIETANNDNNAVTIINVQMDVSSIKLNEQKDI